jgi:drug/metabolite transporter (DMT)-like permease
MESNAKGVVAAFMTPMLLGLAPIFGKLAIHGGADAFSLAAWRTVIAVAFLWIVYLIFFRKYTYIYPAGLLGCVVIGVINGVGSLFYYGGLARIDASLAQLLNGMYLIFVVWMSRFGGEKIDRRVTLRVVLALAALVILTGFGHEPIDWLGVGLMLGSALMFAGTVILSQYVLYEMPARTVALYIVTTMGVVVVMAWAAVGTPASSIATLDVTLPYIFVLGITTALSRLAMFAGVKSLGGLQTAILAIIEIGVALVLAFFVLGERLSQAQLVGVGLLVASLLLIRSRDMLPHGVNPSALLIGNVTNLQFQWIAFEHAFARKKNTTDTQNVMATVTTAELHAIQEMMGATTEPVKPITVPKKPAVRR